MKDNFLPVNACLLFVVMVMGFQTASAQSMIHGSVVDINRKPIPYANVLLLKLSDSSLVKGIVTTEKGTYILQDVLPGKYLVTSTHTGFAQSFTSAIELARNNDIDAGTLELHELSAQLEHVTIIAKKPLLEQKIDRLIVNVANSITFPGNTVLEVLERSPGIIVDHQNNLISMNGKNGVVIMINGKMSRMPVSAVVQMLSGMSSGNIEKIELITTPPASLDAEGNAGYINIVLKENNNFGTNGSYSATIGYGKGRLIQGSFNINHRKGKINLYADLSYSRLKKPLPGHTYARISNKGNITESYIDLHRTDTTPNINGRLGLDLEISRHTVVGILLSGYDNKFTQGETNNYRLIKNNVLDTVGILTNSEMNRWYNYGSNINLQHDFNQNEKLQINFDYIHYANDQPVRYHSAHYNNTGNFVYEQYSRGGKLTPINFFVGAVDYSKKLGKKISMETGLKGTLSTFTNDISFERLIQNSWVKDKNLSAEYKLDEKYSAAYALFNMSVNKKTDAKLGLRYEYTSSNLGTKDKKNIVDRKYGNLFPSFFISHKLNENNSINLSYSRRITRPTFNDLAPYTYFASPTTLLTGNPALQPAIANTVKTDYTYKQYYASLSFSKEDNFIAGFQPETDSITGKIILAPQNLVNRKTISVIISFPITLTKWWTMQYNITGLWQQVNAVYKNKVLQLQQPNININGSQTFTLPKDFSIELSGFYQSPVLNGISLTRAFGSLDAGIKKKLGAKNGSLVLNAGNILNTIRFRENTDLPEQNLVAGLDLRFTHRIFKLTYTRNFGKEKLKQKRERLTGAEDEKSRVQ